MLYAHPRTLPADKTDAPRIAIIVGGLGISATGSADALAKLPAAVTLGFAPYGADLDKLAECARAENHEVLLQAPMEPFQARADLCGRRRLAAQRRQPVRRQP